MMIQLQVLATNSLNIKVPNLLLNCQSIVEQTHYFSPFLSRAAKPRGQLNFVNISCLATLEASANAAAEAVLLAVGGGGGGRWVHDAAASARVEKPWRCLCLGLAVQWMKMMPRRFTTLQNPHNRFTDARTFIFFPPHSLAFSFLFLEPSSRLCYKDTDTRISIEADTAVSQKKTLIRGYVSEFF